MDEEVFLRTVFRNEAVALRLIKEFYGSCFHVKKKKNKVKDGWGKYRGILEKHNPSFGKR
ncbi:hypothetical protein GCM10027175_33450 [Hymenobacter latericoloratus]